MNDIHKYIHSKQEVERQTFRPPLLPGEKQGEYDHVTGEAPPNKVHGFLSWKFELTVLSLRNQKEIMAERGSSAVVNG
ncbi:hypothetical protein [Chania multitudinisentens]|nr:hypothetical protein [Chania multitudinisentens]